MSYLADQDILCQCCADDPVIVYLLFIFSYLKLISVTLPPTQNPQKHPGACKEESQLRHMVLARVKK